MLSILFAFLNTTPFKLQCKVKHIWEGGTIFWHDDLTFNQNVMHYVIIHFIKDIYEAYYHYFKSGF